MIEVIGKHFANLLRIFPKKYSVAIYKFLLSIMKLFYHRLRSFIDHRMFLKKNIKIIKNTQVSKHRNI